MRYGKYFYTILSILAFSTTIQGQQRDATDEIQKRLKAMNIDTTLQVPPMVAGHVTNSSVNVDCSVTQGPFLHPEKYNNFSHSLAFAEQRAGDVKFYNEQGLHGTIYRVWLNENNYFNDKTGKVDFSEVADYLSDASRISDYLLINCTGAGVAGQWKTSPEESVRRLASILRELKISYPQIKYVEVTNEPDFSNLGIRPETYYNVYKVFYQAVNEVNAELKPAVPLLVGGPVTAQFTMTWMAPFLDAYASDSSPGKRLDFISFHGYFTSLGSMNKENPSQVKDQRARLNDELSKRGISSAIPAFVTEMGLYPGPLFDDYTTMRNDHLRQAAGMASLFYWYMGSENIYPFNWVLRHHKEGRKDQLVSRDEKGRPFIQTNKFTPYGNMMLMMSKMKKTRVAVATSQAIDRGKGLYALASVDSSGVSAMLWNYQGIKAEGYTAGISISNLPASLRNKKVRVRVYRIDGKTSNFHSGLDNCNLQIVDEKIVRQKGCYNKSLYLEPNTLQLIVIEPSNKK